MYIITMFQFAVVHTTWGPTIKPFPFRVSIAEVICNGETIYTEKC